jgi:Fe-S-cluster containining protein
MGEVVLFCDLHGHSMKKNAFVYGCHDIFDPRKGKEFPLLMSQIFKGFSFKDCSFLNKDEEEGTCRTVLAKQLKHCNIYAL